MREGGSKRKGWDGVWRREGGSIRKGLMDYGLV